MSEIIEEENRAIDSTFAEPVVVTARLNRRFYEVVVLLLALKEGYKSTLRKKSNDLPHSADEDSDERLFHNFVSRLGQICDSRPGGATVTAFTVLKHPDKVEYVFASNGRKSVELETTRAYISAILASLRESSECEDDDQREEYLRNLLRDVLMFNRERIQRYLKGLETDLKSCITICTAESSSTALSRQKDFDRMLELVQLANESANDDDDEFLDHTEEVIEALKSLQKPATSMFLRRRASNDTAGNTEPWRDLQHRSSRLLAYWRAVEALWESGCMWPELFQTFEVTCIPSSSRAVNPLNVSPQTTIEILTRVITSPVETKGKYLDQARTMQQIVDLDKVIYNDWTSKSFRPIVHAEMLVLNWLENTGGTKPERFFQNWQYIGCSKPLCKLCHYYFSSHPSGVKVRGTHGNLYRNWRMPDCADVCGLRTKEEAVTKRQDIILRIMSDLRQSVERTLNEKITDARRFDSNTISSLAFNHRHIGIGVYNLNLKGSQTSSVIGAESQSLGLNEDWETMDGDSGPRDGGGISLETEASSSSN